MAGSSHSGIEHRAQTEWLDTRHRIAQINQRVIRRNAIRVLQALNKKGVARASSRHLPLVLVVEDDKVIRVLILVMAQPATYETINDE